MKSTYAIAMLLLLLVGVGGSVLGYNKAVNKTQAHEAHAEETAPAEAEASAEPVSEEEVAPAEEAATAEAAPAEAEASAVAVAGDVDHGKAVYATNCSGCHGANAEGGLGPALNDAASWSDSEFLTALRTGDSPAGKLKAPMPQFSESQLSDSDITDIHAFLQTL